MTFDESLTSILKESVRRNGEKPLTNKWLLNIVLLAQQKCGEHEHRNWIAMSDCGDDWDSVS